MHYDVVLLRNFIAISLMVSGIMMLPVSHAFAQNLPNSIPGSADPSRTLDDQKPLPVPDETLAAPAPKKSAVPNIPEGMEKVTFVLQDITVEGMTAYDPIEFVPLYRDMLGGTVSAAQLYEVMGKIQQRYLDDGYALTKVIIPEQDIDNGRVKLLVIEGHVSSVEISPDIRPSPVIDDAARRIAKMRPLNVRTLERIMLIVNDLPDSNLSAVLANPLETGVQELGGVRLILQKNPSKTARGSIGIDNHGSVFTGPWEGKFNAKGYHIGPSYSEFSLFALGTVPLDEQKLLSAAYETPVFGASGAKVNFSIAEARTEPGSNLSTLDIKGSSISYEAGISYPIIRQREMTLVADAGFEWKDARTKILGDELYDDRLRIVKAGLNLNFLDGWAGYNVADIHYSQGLNILGVRKAGSIDLSRADGDPDFKKFEFLAGRVQALPKNFELFAVVNGQYSFNPLLSAEEFGFGGGQIGRGYDSSEITGDHGIAASLELRYRTQLQVFNTTLAMVPYAFYDVGKVWNIDPNSKNNISAASAGLGVRLVLDDRWNMDFNLAKPLTKSAANELKYVNDLGARALFSLTYNF